MYPLIHSFTEMSWACVLFFFWACVLYPLSVLCIFLGNRALMSPGEAMSQLRPSFPAVTMVSAPVTFS